MNEIKNIHVDRDELLQFLQKLISINSVNPSLGTEGKGELEIAHYIGDVLRGMGLEVRFQELGTNRVNVIGVLKGTGGGRSLMLNGHMDTVTARSMHIEPFVPSFRDGDVYGRGALDMKGGIAAQVMAVQAIIRSGIRLQGDVIIAGVADEEYVSMGTEALLKEYITDGAVVCEPTDLQIVTAHKGFVWSTIEIMGRAAHGSMPEKGIDAIMKAGKVLAILDGFDWAVLSGRTHPLLGNPSLHASLIQGGTEWSTYPDYCKIQLERRTIPNELPEDIDEEYRYLLKKIAEEDRLFVASYRRDYYRQPFEISRSSDIVLTLERAARYVLGKEPVIAGASFWMDTALLAAAGIPTVNFGPAGDGLHAAEEYVDFDSVVTTAEVLVRFIIEFCNGEGIH